jgi:hypothetical protein
MMDKDDEALPTFDQLWQEFREVAAGLGFSLNRPVDAIKLAFAMYVQWRDAYLKLQALLRPPSTQSGRKATKQAEDAILLIAMQIARDDGDTRSEASIIRAVA